MDAHCNVFGLRHLIGAEREELQNRGFIKNRQKTYPNLMFPNLCKSNFGSNLKIVKSM